MKTNLELRLCNYNNDTVNVYEIFDDDRIEYKIASLSLKNSTINVQRVLNIDQLNRMNTLVQNYLGNINNKNYEQFVSSSLSDCY